MKGKGDYEVQRIAKKLDRELALLQQRKDSLSETLGKVEEIIGSMQGMEFKLRGEIHDLVKSETRLNEKRMRLRKQLTRVEHEIVKLKQIFSEMEGESG
jgi:chromosome segregation ATPase